MRAELTAAAPVFRQASGTPPNRAAFALHSIAVPARITRRTHSINRLPANGLMRYATALASTERPLAAGSSYAVINMTGHGGCVAVSLSYSSKPVMRGKCTSRTRHAVYGRGVGFEQRFCRGEHAVSNPAALSTPIPPPDSSLHRPRQLSPVAVQTASVHLHEGPPRHVRHKTCRDTLPQP